MIIMGIWTGSDVDISTRMRDDRNLGNAGLVINLRIELTLCAIRALALTPLASKAMDEHET